MHIVVEEAKVFQTKERAPLLLCLEAFRPEELLFMKPQKPLKVSSKSFLNINNQYENYRSSSWNQKDFREIKNSLLVKKRDRGTVINNPYQKKSAHHKEYFMGANYERSVPVAPLAVTKKKNHQKAQAKLKQESNKVNKMLDIKASNPLIINKLRRVIN